jgi:hypothetical protein
MPFKKNPLWNHVDEVINLYEESGSLSYSGKQIVEKYGYNISSDSYRKVIEKIISDNKIPKPSVGILKIKEKVLVKNSDGSEKISEFVTDKLTDKEIYERYNRSEKEWRISQVWFKDVSGGYRMSVLFVPILVRRDGLAKEILEDILKEVKNYSPKYPIIKYSKTKENHLFVISPADVHIGKLSKAFETGDEYNTKIAVSRVMEGVNGLLQKASSFNKDKIMLVIGNDILHVDTPKRTTTSGTPQDTDGMWYENFLAAKKLYIDVIETLISVAPVYVQYDPSNHDYTNGFFLADTIKSWFSKCKHIEFNTSISHRKYYRYHNNLIGTTHGDGAKESNLAQLMAHEASEHWNGCKHRYFYTHHLHHKTSKDYMSVTVETLRSPSGTDSWHHRNGYANSPKAVEGFLHHPIHGQIARITHLF